MQHRPPPDDRRIVGREKPHRDDLQAELLSRHDFLAVGRQLGLQAEHDRHVRTVDVRVNQANAGAAPDQGKRHIDRHGCLADTALSGADGDHVLDAGDGSPATLEPHRFPHPRGHLHIDYGDTWHLHDGRPGLIAHLILDGTRRRRQLDRERHGAPVDLEILDESQRDDVSMQIRVLHDLQGVENRGFSQFHDFKNTTRKASCLPRSASPKGRKFRGLCHREGAAGRPSRASGRRGAPTAGGGVRARPPRRE